MFAIIVGSGLFGFTGMLISVPVFAVIYALLREALTNRLKSKGLPINSSEYKRPGVLKDTADEGESEPAEPTGDSRQETETEK